MSSEITYADAGELAALIRRREISPVEVAQAHLDRIAAVDPEINAIVTVSTRVLEDAKVAEAAVLSGVELGPLHGVPFTVKDSIDTEGLLTQRGSPIFRGRIPKVDAVSVARLKQAGAVVLAKTNLPEFSYATETDNLLSGRSNNPWNLDRTPGGSSGGESAAIAAGMSPLGLGTDVAISVRGPAAQTGIVGLKATHGRIPMTGVWPRVPRRFWHVGPMARSVRDVAMAYALLAGPDGADAYASATPSGDAGLGVTDIRAARVGWLVEPGFGPIDPGVAATVRVAAEALADAGCVVEPVRIPALERDFALDVFSRISVMEIKPEFAEVTAGHPEDELGRISRSVRSTPDTTIAAYVDAVQAADRLKDGFAQYFRRYDALLCPVLPIPAHGHGLADVVIDGHTVDRSYVMAVTATFNVTGLPALSMRFGTSRDGLPIGVQLAATWSAESTVLGLASLLESVSPVRDSHPEL